MGEKPQETMTDAVEVDKKKRKRRPPLVPWKKPKDMPRRPLSAYNLFFKEQREAMMATLAATERIAAEANLAADCDKSGDASVGSCIVVAGKSRRKRSNKSVGIGFANLARTIAADWKDLDDETRAPYEAIAAKEKARYKDEMLLWRAKQKEDKERAAAGKEQGGGGDQMSYTGGPMDSSGETSMDDSHSSARTTPVAMPGQTTATSKFIGMVNPHPMEVDSPKRTRHSYEQPGGRSMLAHMLSPIDDMDLNPIQLLSANDQSRRRWPHDGSQSYPLGLDHMRAASASNAAFRQQPLHSSLSRLDSLQANSMMMDDSRMVSMGLGTVRESAISSHGMPTMSMYDPSASDSDIRMLFSPGSYRSSNNAMMMTGTMMNRSQYHYGNSNMSSSSEMLHEEERQLIMQQQHLIRQQKMLEQQHLKLFQQQESLHQQPFHGQQYHGIAARRNTWSGGAAGDESNRSEGEAGAPERLTSAGSRRSFHNSFTPPPQATPSFVTRPSIPDSWFEPEDLPSQDGASHSQHDNEPLPAHSNQGPAPSSQDISVPSRRSMYPDNWFEIGDEDSPQTESHEPIRYSPDGDITCKLPGSSSGFRKPSDIPTFPKLGSDSRSLPGDEGKREETFHPPARRSLEDLTGANASVVPPSMAIRMDTANEDSPLDRRVMDEPIPQDVGNTPASLRSLGMQFDDDTMDFLARLRHTSTGE